jgi:hypothetical protein
VNIHATADWSNNLHKKISPFIERREVALTAI